ncbi:protein quiver isoform X2 [Eurytemora carolleeae]|uniref:protein quiver isoform X2 n=1 Tax=Eurytemora carolleeae TaxID=1294199 RepID=UPI000C76CDE8|nr:protein quiver isoform X2 [Eurytemora carolleeae]|eukprot:XP_023343945.1 protein quiver-like isoform X2 [Eurytemora affinis]
MFVQFVFVLLGLEVCTRVEGITCYICESYRDFRCLDPFDYQPFVQMNCDQASWVREKNPVFCEKRTEVVDGVYVTTRGCSIDFKWEDVQEYADHRGGRIPCIRRGRKETCLCTEDRCNSSKSLNLVFSFPVLLILTFVFQSFSS